MARFAAFVLGLALAVSGAPSFGGAGGVAVAQGAQAAQALNPCALLTVDEIESSVAAKSTVADGVSNASPDVGYASCRYIWGAGTSRFRLDVDVAESARMFPGMTPDQMKQQLVQSVRTGTGDSLIPEIGETAMFKADSPVYATATSLLKGRVLQVHLDGAYAGEMKDQVVGLLKSAAARL